MFFSFELLSGSFVLTLHTRTYYYFSTYIFLLSKLFFKLYFISPLTILSLRVDVECKWIIAVLREQISHFLLFYNSHIQREQVNQKKITEISVLGRESTPLSGTLEFEGTFFAEIIFSIAEISKFRVKYAFPFDISNDDIFWFNGNVYKYILCI